MSLQISTPANFSLFAPDGTILASSRSVKLFHSFVIATCLATLPGTVFAEDLSSVSLFDFEAGVRNLGMGATGVAATSEAANSYYNPASLSWARGLTVTYEAQPIDILSLELDMSEARVAFGHAWPAGVWQVGLEAGYRRIHHQIDSIIAPGTAITDECYSGALAIGYRRGRLALSGGASAKLATVADEELGDAEVFVLNTGLIVAFPLLMEGTLLEPRLGASIGNLDNGLDWFGMMYGIKDVKRFGAGVDIATPGRRWAGRSVSVATASVEAQYTTRGSDEWVWAVGWEVSVFECVFLRAGYEWMKDDVYTVRDLGVGLGWEFDWLMVRADYAHRTPNNDFGVDLSRDAFGATLGARF